MESITVRVPDGVKEWIEENVEDGRFDSESQAVRKLIKYSLYNKIRFGAVDMSIINRYKRYAYPSGKYEDNNSIDEIQEDVMVDGNVENHDNTDPVTSNKDFSAVENRLLISKMGKRMVRIDERTAFNARILMMLIGSLILATLSGVIILAISP